MPNMVTNHPPFFPLFFSDFVAILLLFFIQHSHTFHIWKCAFDPEYNAQHGHQPTSIFFHFFLIFSLFYCHFSFSIATISIFGNMHWTLNTMPNMVTNHPPFFPLFFCDFFAILLLFLLQHSHNFHIWKCALDPEHTMPNMVTNHPPFFPLFFSLFYCYFSLSIATLSIFGSAH